MKLSQIKQLSQTKYLPIIRPKSEEALCALLRQNAPRKILEVGTFYGYSGSVMLQCCKEANLCTIEKNAENAAIAKQTFTDEQVADRVRLIESDAMDAICMLESQGEKFDFIFLDGAKGQYTKYLPHLKSLLNKGGILLADDISFHGYVAEQTVKHKHRTIVNNLKKFISQVTSDNDFESEVFEIEDGLLIARKTK